MPAVLVEVGDLLRSCIEIIGHDAQHFATIDDYPDLADRHLQRVLRLAARRFGRWPMRSLTMVLFLATRFSRTTVNGVFFFSRVTKRQHAVSTSAHQR